MKGKKLPWQGGVWNQKQKKSHFSPICMQYFRILSVYMGV